MSAVKKKQKAAAEQEAQSDAEWDRTFANSHDALAKLAAKARKEYREGRTEELEPDNLSERAYLNSNIKT